jgi:hypothetical protein
MAGLGLAAGLTGHTFEARDILAFSAGPVIIRPRLTVIEEYNDNLYYSPVDTVSDFITTVNPAVGFHLGKPGADASVDLGYAYSHLWYAENGDNESSIHQVNLGASYQRTRFSSLTTFNYSIMDTIYGGYESFSQGGGGLGRTILRQMLGFTETLGYDLTEKLETHGTFALNDTDFLDTGTYYDQNIWRITAGAGFKIRPKVHLIADLYYGQTAAEPNLPFNDPLVPTSIKPPHMSTLGGYTGANIELTTNVKAHAKVGYETSDFDTDSFGGISADVGLEGQLGDRTSVQLAYRRGTSASVQAYATGYVSDAVTLGMTQLIGSSVRPWQLSLRGSYGGNTYETGPSVGLHRSYFDINLGVRYQPKQWLAFALNYIYSNQFGDSNSSVDSQVNRVTLSASVGY